MSDNNGDTFDRILEAFVKILKVFWTGFKKLLGIVIDGMTVFTGAHSRGMAIFCLILLICLGICLFIIYKLILALGNSGADIQISNHGPFNGAGRTEHYTNRPLGISITGWVILGLIALIFIIGL